MGASISVGHGAQQAFSKFRDEYRVVATIGDSTFFHTGVNSLMHIAYNQSKTVTCILDNRITGMTGHQENPGTGYTLQGKPTKIVDIPALCKAIGIEQIRVINPTNLTEVKDAFDWAFSLEEPSVIITRWPCILKKQSPEDQREFGDYKTKCEVEASKCIGCKACIKTGCPALQFNKPAKKVEIDSAQCIGCGVCQQVCPVQAITKVAK